MYLRHEAGHAFTYAYKLHNKPDWKQIFGPFRRPYRDNYQPAPFSRDYVRICRDGMRRSIQTKILPRPLRCGLRRDQTGASGIAAGVRWKSWRYLNRLAPKLGKSDPARRRGLTDLTVDEMETTVAEFYNLQQARRRSRRDRAHADTDMRDIFPVSKRRKAALPAHEFLQSASQSGDRQSCAVDRWRSVR